MSLRLEIMLLSFLLNASNARFNVCIFDLPLVWRLEALFNFECRLSRDLSFFPCSSICALLDLDVPRDLRSHVLVAGG